MAAPITTSADEIAALQAELGAIHAGRAAAMAGDAGASYSISGANGSESVDVVGYLRYLNEREEWIVQRLQDLQPFMVVQRQLIRGGLDARGRRL